MPLELGRILAKWGSKSLTIGDDVGHYRRCGMTDPHQLELANTLLSIGSFLVIFLAARTLAELMVRLQLPTILGELLGGVLIGVSGLHLIGAPEAMASGGNGMLDLVGLVTHLDGPDLLHVYGGVYTTLEQVATLGLYSLLFQAGLESELDLLLAVALQATSVALAGVLLPFAAATSGLMLLFGVDLVPAIFAGASLTATSIGITASVFGELGVLRSREGQIVVGAAVLDDILGIVILAVVVSLAGGAQPELGSILQVVVAAVVFVVASVLLSRRAAPWFDGLVEQLKAPGEMVVASYAVLAVVCVLSSAIGLEAALGAYAAGLMLSNSSRLKAIKAGVQPVASLFSTVFFVLIGAGLELSVLNPMESANRPGLVVAIFLLLVAIAGKVMAGWSFFSEQPVRRLLVGIGMIPRGEVGLIFLGLGRQDQILSPALESGILLAVIGTTFLAPVLLRQVLNPRAA
jgi:Kef-type K+ transport system membrane component KefB